MSKSLPPLSHILLALLADSSPVGASGYDLLMRWEQTLTHCAPVPARSQLYLELAQLDAAGYLSMKRIVQDTRPDKRVYRLTDTGRAVLDAWRMTAPEADVYKSETLLRLALGHLDEAQLETMLRARYAVYELRCTDLTARIDALRGDASQTTLVMTLEHALAMAETELAWLTQTLPLLAAHA